MINSFFIAATGMHAQQAELDTVANNLVNMNTTAFKKSRVAFETLMPEPGAQGPAAAGGAMPAAYFGMGVSGADAQIDFTSGNLQQTQGQFDFAIQGNGLFEVQLPDGTLAYTRNGALHVDNDGYLVTADGYPLSAMLQIPADAQQVVVDADGHVRIKTPNSDQLTDAGYLELSQFSDAAGLKPIGNNLYFATGTSGDVVYSRPGENGAGTLSQGYLESSNVQMIDEITSMVTAQRAYAANSKVLQASDDILGIINNLRK